jgi:hypothetical protein
VAACDRAATVRGEEAVAERVRELLRARGVDTSPSASCDAPYAEVHRTEEDLKVEVILSNGHTVTRRVSAPDTAAALIESWTVRDISLEPSLAPADSSPNDDDPKPNSNADTDIDENPKPPQTHTSNATTDVGGASARAATRISLHAAASAGLDADTSTWMLGELGACVPLGPLCAGMLVRGVFDTGQTGLSGQLASGRVGADFMMTFAWPISLGSLSLRPTAGLGAGWMRSSYQATTSAGYQQSDIDSGGPRVSGGALLGVPLSGSYQIEMGLFVDVSPLVRSTTLRDDGVKLAGQPGFVARAAVGFRWGD